MAFGNWTAILGNGERGEKVVRRREGGKKRGREGRRGEIERTIVRSLFMLTSLKASAYCLGAECSSVIGQALICPLTSTEGTNPHTNAVYSVLGWRGPFLYNSGKSFRLLSFAPSTKVVG